MPGNVEEARETYGSIACSVWVKRRTLETALGIAVEAVAAMQMTLVFAAMASTLAPGGLASRGVRITRQFAV